MRSTASRTVFCELGRLADSAVGPRWSDADLLEGLRSLHQEEAFSLLVRRHGPLVLGVCRRILRDEHEAEDAFQATFLVLARKAGSIRQGSSLAGFLHGVAYRVAVRARARSARRRLQGKSQDPLSPDPEVLDTLAEKELRAALDEEVRRLPACYREPLLLCGLEGMAHEQAARVLGWPKSSVTARLKRGRELLRQRLARRGFTPAAGLVAEQALPPRLLQATVQHALAALTGPATASFPAAGIALLLAVGLLAGSLAALAFSRPAPPPPANQKAQAPIPAKRTDSVGDPLPAEALARMGSGRMRHGSFCRIAFSPDGKALLSAGFVDVRLWEVSSGKLQRRIEVRAETFWPRGFDYSPGRITVASADFLTRTATVQVFDPVKGAVRNRLTIKDQPIVEAPALSPGGKRLVLIARNQVWLYDTATGEKKLSIPRGTRTAREVAFRPDGKTFAICDFTDTIRVFDADTGAEVRALKRGKDQVGQLAWSPDGRQLASITYNERQEDRGISIWDPETGKERLRLPSPREHPLCAAFSPDGKLIASGGQHRYLILWDAATGKEIRRLPAHGYCGSITFSPDSKVLAGTFGGVICRWDVATGRPLPGGADPLVTTVRQLRFSGDGKQLFGTSAVRIAWDPATGREVRRLPQLPTDFWSLAYSPDEGLVAGSAGDGTIHLHDPRTTREVRVLRGHESRVWSVLFSADGKRLFSTSTDGTIRVWDPATGRESFRLAAPDKRTMELAASPDGRWLASASDGRGRGGLYEVLLWDVNGRREKARLSVSRNTSAAALAFSPDSRLLAVVGGGERDRQGTVTLWDVASARVWWTLSDHKERVASAIFSPDGRMLVTADWDGRLVLWELASKQPRHRFTGHERAVHSLAFSPDGRRLAAASVDAPVFVWDVAGTLERPRGNLSPKELEGCWADLAGTDAARAFQAIRRLAAVPGSALPFLRKQLRPLPPVDDKRVRTLLAALDSDEFDKRRKAAAELDRLADRCVGQLRRAVRESASAEVRRTLREILARQEAGKPEQLRTVRAVEALEWMATPAAIQLLGVLSRGAAGAGLTREAAAARDRLRKRR